MTPLDIVLQIRLELYYRNRRGTNAMKPRFAHELSESLFNSIYADLFRIASLANKAAYRRSKTWRPTVTEEQDALNDFCFGRMSVLDALDYIKRTSWRFTSA